MKRLFVLLAIGFLICAAIAAQSKPVGAPSVLPRKALTEHLLPLNANWMQYYDVAPKDTIQLYYNVWVAIDNAKRTQIQIRALQERVAALEKKLSPPIQGDAGQAAPDINAPSDPASSQGDAVAEKPAD